MASPMGENATTAFQDPFLDSAIRFARFLARLPPPGAVPSPAAAAPVLATLVTPWHRTAVPFYNIFLGIAAALEGYRVRFLWDDLVWTEPESAAVQNQVIGRLLETAGGYGTVVQVGRFQGPPASADEMRELDKLAEMNAVWKFRTPERTEAWEAFRRSCARHFAANYPSAKAALAAAGAKVLLTPGGVNGCSGLHLLAGAGLGVRTATYDCAPGEVIVGTAGVAGHLLDLSRVLQEPAFQPTAGDREWIRAEAGKEFAARKQRTDTLRFQVVGASGDAGGGSWDVVMPLNVMWDTAALGRHTVFADTLQWVEETLAWILDHTEATVVLRQHPRERIWQERFGYANPMEAILRARFGARRRWRFIRAEEAVNTYDLLGRARLVLPSTSTVGLEAVLQGIPVVTDCRVYYASLPGVLTATTRDAYFAAIGDTLAAAVPERRTPSWEAWNCYYLSQRCNYIRTGVTAMPEDFDLWVRGEPAGILADPGFSIIRESMFTGAPAAYLNYRRQAGERGTQDQPAAARMESETAPDPMEETAMNSTAMERHVSGDLGNRFPDVSFGQDVQVIGMNHVAIGRGSCVGDGTWLNVCERTGDIRLRIGRKVLIGRYSMVSTGGELEIGDFSLFAPRVYVSDADHIYQDIERPYIEQGATLGRKVIVEENCWVGINAVISGNLIVGYGSVVAANSVVLENVPPFAVVAGIPARIIKLYNPKSRRWENAQTFSDQLRILEDRMEVPLPERDEYRETLWKRSRLERIDPVLAGSGRHLP